MHSTAVAASAIPARHGLGHRFTDTAQTVGLPSGPGDHTVVTAKQIAHLPPVVRRYMGFMGVVGQPRVWSFRVRFQGRFRLRRGLGWMPAEAWQYNSSVQIGRMFVMRIRFAGIIPMYGSDTYLSGHGRMTGKLFGHFTVVDDEGPEFDIGELTTYLNDAIMLAPSMLLTPSTTWTEVDRHSFDVTLVDAGRSVTGRVFVDDTGAPFDFSTTDRYAACHPVWCAPNGERRCRTGNRSTAGWFPVRSVRSGGCQVATCPISRARAMSNSLQLNISPVIVTRRQTAPKRVPPDRHGSTHDLLESSPQPRPDHDRRHRCGLRVSRAEPATALGGLDDEVTLKCPAPHRRLRRATTT